MTTKIVVGCFLVAVYVGGNLCGMNKDQGKVGLLSGNSVKQHSYKVDIDKFILDNVFFRQTEVSPKQLESPFFEAVKHQDIQSVAYLLKKCPDLITSTHEGHLALYYAVEFNGDMGLNTVEVKNNTDLIALLLLYGAVISENIIKHAMECADQSVQNFLIRVKLCLEKGADWDWTNVENKNMYKELLEEKIDLYELAKVCNNKELLKKLKPVHKKKWIADLMKNIEKMFI